MQREADVLRGGSIRCRSVPPSPHEPEVTFLRIAMAQLRHLDGSSKCSPGSPVPSRRRLHMDAPMTPSDVIPD